MRPGRIKSHDGRCISKDEHPREKCSGGCDSFEYSYVRVNGTMIIGNKVCKCCAAEQVEIEQIEMICDQESVKAEYVRIKKCKCDMCGAHLEQQQP